MVARDDDIMSPHPVRLIRSIPDNGVYPTLAGPLEAAHEAEARIFRSLDQTNPDERLIIG